MNWMFNDYSTGHVFKKFEDWRPLYIYTTTDGKKYFVEYDNNGGTGDVRSK